MLRFFGPDLARTGLVASKLTAPFSRVVDRVVTHPWLRSFIDLECFVLRSVHITFRLASWTALL